MSIMYIISFILLFRTSTALNQNPSTLNSNYPFSTKIATNKAVIFEKDKIDTYNVANVNTQPLSSESIGCDSTTEKSGIVVNNNYHTSCLTTTPVGFRIHIYPSPSSSPTILHPYDYATTP